LMQKWEWKRAEEMKKAEKTTTPSRIWNLEYSRNGSDEIPRILDGFPSTTSREFDFKAKTYFKAKWNILEVLLFQESANW
jgi:hypothetical protein